MTDSHKRVEPMTAEAFVDWSEASDARAELLDGRIVTMISERAGHARLKTKAYEALARQIGERGLACEAFADGMAVRVDGAVRATGRRRGAVDRRSAHRRRGRLAILAAD